MPTPWDRLTDATQPTAAASTLGVVTLGHVHEQDIAALTPHFARIEQLVLDVAPRDPLEQHRAELNRAIDAASGDWILIVRERETIAAELASEIAAEITSGRSRGFRIRSTPIYAGKPLLIEHDPSGELRLFHRRYFLRRGDLGVQGTVVRLKHAFRSMSFESTAAHREQLARTGKPNSKLRQTLLFVRYALQAKTLDRNTLRYLWIEAGFDQGQVITGVA